MATRVDWGRRVSGTSKEHAEDAAFPRFVKNRLVKLRTNRAEAVCPANVVYAVHCNPRLSCHV
jgi:hypothetical protein